jgi:tellurite methyltransferase
MVSATEKWDAIYAQRADRKPEPAGVLLDYSWLLPAQGRALDLACGLGGNALFLARAGLITEAWDISATAVERLQRSAATEGLPIRTCLLDICPACLVPASFDVIAVSRFLDRSLCPAITTALKPGGLLFYQTYTREKTVAQGPSNPDYLLDVNELLRLFTPLRIVFYREHGMIGDLRQGLRNEAQLIGQKRPIPETSHD